MELFYFEQKNRVLGHCAPLRRQGSAVIRAHLRAVLFVGLIVLPLVGGGSSLLFKWRLCIFAAQFARQILASSGTFRVARPSTRWTPVSGAVRGRAALSPHTIHLSSDMFRSRR